MLPKAREDFTFQLLFSGIMPGNAFLRMYVSTGTSIKIHLWVHGGPSGLPCTLWVLKKCLLSTWPWISHFLLVSVRD